MTTSNFQALAQAVLASSVSRQWGGAVLEWTVVGLEEDPTGQGVCVCGQSNLVKLFTIRNQRNGLFLSPIGSNCVNQFEREDLDLQVDQLLKLRTLRTAILVEPQNITLAAPYFSRSMLEHLYIRGAFPPDQWNHHNGDNDYDFLRKMFNKKDKDGISPAQRRKIYQLLHRKVFPFVLNDERLG